MGTEEKEKALQFLSPLLLLNFLKPAFEFQTANQRREREGAAAAAASSRNRKPSNFPGKKMPFILRPVLSFSSSSFRPLSLSPPLLFFHNLLFLAVDSDGRRDPPSLHF